MIGFILYTLIGLLFYENSKYSDISIFDRIIYSMIWPIIIIIAIIIYIEDKTS